MNELITAIYAEKKTFFPFGENHIIGFLNEEIVENWKQPNAPEDAAPITGYSYKGKREDGGTLLPCDNPSDYGSVTCAIIRSRYSESDEIAIHRHYVNDQEGYLIEWQEYDRFCEQAKLLAKQWLGIAE